MLNSLSKSYPRFLLYMGAAIALNACDKSYETDKAKFTEAIKTEKAPAYLDKFYYQFPDQFKSSGIDPRNAEDVAKLMGVTFNGKPNQVLYQLKISQVSASESSIDEENERVIDVTFETAEFFGNILLLSQSLQYDGKNNISESFAEKLQRSIEASKAQSAPSL